MLELIIASIESSEVSLHVILRSVQDFDLRSPSHVQIRDQEPSFKVKCIHFDQSEESEECSWKFRVQLGAFPI